MIKCGDTLLHCFMKNGDLNFQAYSDPSLFKLKTEEVFQTQLTGTIMKIFYSSSTSDCCMQEADSHSIQTFSQRKIKTMIISFTQFQELFICCWAFSENSPEKYNFLMTPPEPSISNTPNTPTTQKYTPNNKRTQTCTRTRALENKKTNTLNKQIITAKN